MTQCWQMKFIVARESCASLRAVVAEHSGQKLNRFALYEMCATSVFPIFDCVVNSFFGVRVKNIDMCRMCSDFMTDFNQPRGE